MIQNNNEANRVDKIVTRTYFDGPTTRTAFGTGLNFDVDGDELSTVGYL